VTQYATAGELADQGLPTLALEGIETATLDASLLYASRVIDGYVKKRYTVPLTTWGEDVTRAAIHIAQFDIMSRRGFRPGAGADEIIVKRYDDTINWLRDVAKKLVELTDVTEGDPEIAAPIAESDGVIDWAFNTRGRRDDLA
jgi:phage gp36-like protein